LCKGLPPVTVALTPSIQPRVERRPHMTIEFVQTSKVSYYPIVIVIARQLGVERSEQLRQFLMSIRSTPLREVLL